MASVRAVDTHVYTTRAYTHDHTSVEEWATQAARGRWRRGSARERGRSAALLGLARACETSRLLRRGAATPTVVCHVRTGFLLSSRTCSDTSRVTERDAVVETRHVAVNGVAGVNWVKLAFTATFTDSISAETASPQLICYPRPWRPWRWRCARFRWARLCVGACWLNVPTAWLRLLILLQPLGRTGRG